MDPRSDTPPISDRCERTMTPPPRRQRSIAIASGKGGVGKTCLAISLAASLARDGVSVLLVDGDLGLANVDVQLGLSAERDLGDVIDGHCALADAVTPFREGGFDVLPGRAGSGALSTMPATDLEMLLLKLGEDREHDVVLLDLGAGIDRALRRMACWADTLLVVATDEPTSLTDAYAVLKVHAEDKRRLAKVGSAPTAVDTRVLINQAASHASGEQTFATLARVCQTFLGITPVNAGVIRRDGRMRDAIRSQTPLPLRYPVSAASQDIERVALALRCVDSPR